MDWITNPPSPAPATMMKTYPQFAILLALTINLAAHAAEPTTDNPFPPSRFESDIQAFEEADRQTPPPSHAILFLGSSSIRKWDVQKSFPDLTTLNRGFGGSQIADSTAFVDRIVVPYAPRQIVFYAGDNDISKGLSPQTVCANFQAFVNAVHAQCPNLPILYISIKTSHSRLEFIPPMEEANQLVQQFCATKPSLAFLDVDTPMRGPDNTPRKDLFLDDQLHLNDAGYQLWTRLIRPLLTPEPPGQS